MSDSPSASTETTSPALGAPSRVRIVVATSVMLSFISFWRAAAIVLNDLASTAYYIGGITEEAIGKAAPWFVLAVILFASAVRAVYVESCAMFTRGGVYRVVTPEECVALAAEVGTLVLHPLMGGMPPELGWASLELFAAKVLPRLRA